MQNYFMRKSLDALFTILILSVLVSGVFAQNMFRKVTDFDGDGKTDYAITRAENGLKIWYIWQSTAGFKAFHWGIASDRTAASDYDGDGKTDFAVWRYTTNGDTTTFFILESQTNTIFGKTFGNIPVSAMMHQDYNGDGKTDAGVITGDSGLNLFVSYSGSNSGFAAPITQGFFAIRCGDMDGDGRADIVERGFNNASIIRIIDSSTNTARVLQFGVSTDQFQMADFDGDGKGDLTVWRNSDGMWWWIRSSDNVVNAAQWGIPNDTPVPGDYDGDGKTDLAIYRRESPQSHYWIYGSKSGVSVVAWGISTDSAVSY